MAKNYEITEFTLIMLVILMPMSFQTKLLQLNN